MYNSPVSSISRFASASPSSGGQQQQHHGGSLALVKRLKLLASDVDNQPVVCRRGILPSLLLFLQNTDPEVRHTAAETLVLLSSHPENPDCLCRERGLVQIVVSSYRSSKENDPTFHELCGTIIKNLGSAVHHTINEQGELNNNSNRMMTSPQNNNNNQRSGSTFTQLEFLSGSRDRNNISENNNGNFQSPEHNHSHHRTPSPNINNNNNDENNNENGGLSSTKLMTTTRRYNPRTRQSHFINGGLPSTASCRNVQLRVSELIPSKRQQLVECLHTTRGVISYTIDLPTRNLTVFLSVPAQNLITTLGEDGFDDVEILADIEVQMSNHHANNDENNSNSNNTNHDGINLNDYYHQQQNGHNNSVVGSAGADLSEYKKSLMIGGDDDDNSNKYSTSGSLIARIQKRKEQEKQAASVWNGVWQTLKNVFW